MADWDVATEAPHDAWSVQSQDYYNRLTKAQDQNPALTMNPLERAAAGAGAAIDQTRLGAKQLFTQISSVPELFTGDTARRDRALAAAQRVLDEVQEQRRVNAPLLATTAGKVGNVAGHAALAAPTMLLPGANTILGAGALGAGYGALQPALDAKETGRNMLAGLAGGAGLTAVARGAGALYSGVVDPLTPGGAQRVALNALERFARDPANLRRPVTELVPGSRPTLAEVTGDPGIAQLQRAAQAQPEVANALAQVRTERLAARQDAMRQAFGTDATLAQAQAARSQAVNPYYAQVAQSTAEVNPKRTVDLIDRIVAANPKREQLVSQLSKVRDTLFDRYEPADRARDAWRGVGELLQTNTRMSSADHQALRQARTLLARLKDGRADVNDTAAALRGLKVTSKAAGDTLQWAAENVALPDHVLASNPRALQSASQNIGDLLATKGPTGAPINEAITRELSTVKRSLDAQIGKAEPAYRDAQQLYRELSRPIAQMQIGQYLYGKLFPALTEQGAERVTPGRFAELLRDGDATAAKVTGFKRAKLADILTPEQRQTLDSLSQDFAREVKAQEQGKIPGSPTAQYLVGQNLLRQAMGPLGLPESWSESLLADTLSNRWVSAGLKPVEHRAQNALAEFLVNPQAYQAANSARGLATTALGRLAGRTTNAIAPVVRGVLPPASVGGAPAYLQPVQPGDQQ